MDFILRICTEVTSADFKIIVTKKPPAFYLKLAVFIFCKTKLNIRNYKLITGMNKIGRFQLAPICFKNGVVFIGITIIMFRYFAQGLSAFHGVVGINRGI